jgi:hypothetical protein
MIWKFEDEVNIKFRHKVRCRKGLFKNCFPEKKLS